MQSVLLPSEVEFYVDTMRPQTMVNIGSKGWLDWHQRLQKLNQEALVEASELREEYVKEALVSFEKVKVLVHEAILINIWKHKILPLLLKMEPRPESTMMAYSVLYHEAVCVALLELVTYHANCCDSLDDLAIDLLDYACGQASRLLSVQFKEPKIRESALEEIERQIDNLTFDIGIRCLTIVRYISENMATLPLSITTRIYSTYDIPVLFVQLLEAKPWINKEKKQYKNSTWKEWDQESLCQSEAQVWLTLRQILLDPRCQENYQISSSRKNQLMKMAPLLNPTLLDQLSPLIELQMWINRLAVMDTPNAQPKPYIIETNLEIKEKILEQTGKKWKSIAKEQLPNIFAKDTKTLVETARTLNEAFNTDLLEQLDVKDRVECAKCGKDSIQRCSRCKKTWYCSRACQVSHWSVHKNDCKEAAH